jgi:hypothetical protein
MNPWSKLLACGALGRLAFGRLGRNAGFRAGMPRGVAQQIRKLL